MLNTIKGQIKHLDLYLELRTLTKALWVHKVQFTSE